MRGVCLRPMRNKPNTTPCTRIETRKGDGPLREGGCSVKSVTRPEDLMIGKAPAHPHRRYVFLQFSPYSVCFHKRTVAKQSLRRAISSLNATVAASSAGGDLLCHRSGPSCQMKQHESDRDALLPGIVTSTLQFPGQSA